MKRTLHMIGPFPQLNNGVSDYMEAYKRAFQRKGYEVKVTKIYFLENKLNQLQWLLLSLRGLFWKGEVYLIQHTPTISGPFILLFLKWGRCFEWKIVVVAHETPETYLKHLKGVWKKVYFWYEKSIVNWACTYVVHTRQHQHSIVRLGAKRPPQIVAHPIFARPVEPVHRSKPLWGSYGQISPKKGVNLLLEAYQSEPPGNFPELIIIGEAAPGNEAYVQELKEKVRKSHQDFIRFIGYVSNEERDTLFQQITLMIFPYRWISQSGALAESCRYRIPYLASNLEYFKDFNRSFGCGALFETESVVSLVGALKKLTGSPINIPQKEFENLFEKCSLEHCAEQLEGVF